MTIANTQSTGASDAYDTIRADESIQFTPIENPEPVAPPSWLTDFLTFMSDLLEPVGRFFGSSWPITKWILIAAAIGLFVYLLWKLLAPALRLTSGSSPEADEWIPAEQDARALLIDADRLAAEGQYDAATHLLLKRSVGQIADARPDWVDPSTTARELARLNTLPSAAREAFGTIADRVERSLFALRKLSADDWQTARAAYAQFALQRLGDEG